MSYENIIASSHDHVGVVQINRPKAMNALNTPTMEEIVAAMRAFDADDEIGCMVLTGSDKAFAAGADIKQMAEASVTEMLNMTFLNLWDDLRSINKPIIAAVSGYCLGGGNELAMACDLMVASETAKFGQPEINLGIIPGAGGTQRLTHAVGKSIAMEMVLNARFLSAQEALQYGLVSRVFPAESYLTDAIALAAEIAGRAPWAVRMGKAAVNRAFELSLNEGLAAERDLFAMLFATADQKEGMAAFIEKRQANWQGR